MALAMIDRRGCGCARRITLGADKALFDEDGGEFAFDCLTGSIHVACDGDAVEFDRTK
jgi:hypothetical protein